MNQGAGMDQGGRRRREQDPNQDSQPPKRMCTSEAQVLASVIKEHEAESRYDITELFSPTRITAFTKAWDLRGGWAMDLSQPCPVTSKVWDFRLKADRERAKAMVRQQKPWFVWRCLPCTMYSNLQNLNPKKIAPNGWRRKRRRTSLLTLP